MIAVDGVDAGGRARRGARARSARRARGGISRWDASGVFQELAVADDAAGAPSARTLLLLYAADLAFRLRWQIRPALAEGRTVVAAPYVDTAMAFGRAAGLKPAWLIEPVPLRAARRRSGGSCIRDAARRRRREGWVRRDSAATRSPPAHAQERTPPDHRRRRAAHLRAPRSR